MILLRFPIAYAVDLASVACMIVYGGGQTDIITTRFSVLRLMVKGISSFSLMAVPFFITMGILMGSGGISEKLIALANGMPSGLAQVNVVASYFFGGISGSTAIAVICSLIVSVFIYKGLNWKGAWNALEECVNTLSNVLILITSAIFGNCLTLLKVPQMVANALTSLTNNRIILTLLLNLILNCGIGLLTPPVGSVLFIGSAVGKISIERLVKATLPFCLCMIITLLLVSFIPKVSLPLPRLLGG